MSGIIAVYGLVVSVLIAGGREYTPFYEAYSLRVAQAAFVPHSHPVPPFSIRPSPVKPNDYPLYAGFIHLGAGLACGFTGLAAGYAIGYVGDSVSPLVLQCIC